MLEVNLKFEQVKSLAAEYEELGKTMFLVKHNAIKVDKDGSWSVLQFEGLKLSLMDALPGVPYETDIPYTLWKEIVRQVEYFIYKREEKAKAQAEATKPQ
jgi:hypothetical protein